MIKLTRWVSAVALVSVLHFGLGAGLCFAETDAERRAQTLKDKATFEEREREEKEFKKAQKEKKKKEQKAKKSAKSGKPESKLDVEFGKGFQKSNFSPKAGFLQKNINKSQNKSKKKK